MMQPIPKFHFEVNWKGTRTYFSEINGLGNVTKLVDYRDKVQSEGGKLITALPQKLSTITLKRGLVKGNKAFLKPCLKRTR